MQITTLDEFMAVNDQFAALIDAGAALDLGLEAVDNDPEAALERINAAIARRVSRGETLLQAIDNEPSLPAPYRSVIQVGVRGDDLHLALATAADAASSAGEVRRSVRNAFLYPLVVCGLAALGFVAYLLVVLPRLESVRETLRLPSTGAFSVESLKPLGGFAAALVGCLLVVLVVARLMGWIRGGRFASTRQGGLAARLLGATAAAEQARRATFAKTLAVLAGGGTPLADALPIAADASGDARLSRGAERLSAALRQQGTVTGDDPAAAAFPPFLRWALLSAEPAVSRPRALDMAAEVYGQAARRRTERVRFAAPLFTCVFVGGTAVFLYALALFVPLIDLVKVLPTLSAPNVQRLGGVTTAHENDMPRFAYQALNADDGSVAGHVDADNVQQAITQLEAAGLVVQSIGVAPLTPGDERAAATDHASSSQATLREHMGRVLAQGQSIAPALAAYADELPAGAERRQLREVCRVLERGDAAEATAVLAQLPEYWVSLLSASSSSRDPARVLNQFLDESLEAVELRRQSRQIWAYPLVVVGLALAVMVTLSVLIIPGFRQIFADFDLELPKLTLLTLRMGEVLASKPALIAMATFVALVIAALVMPRKLSSGAGGPLADWWSGWWDRAPRIADFARFTAELLEAGLRLPDALRLAGQATRRPRVQHAGELLAADLERGRPPTAVSYRDALTSTVVYALATEMPAAARVRLLKEISASHADRLRGRLSWTHGILGPIAVCVTSVIVGFVVLSLFLPLVDLINNLSG